MHKTQFVIETKNLDVTQLVGQFDDKSLKEEMETCKHLFVGSELANGRQRVFKISMDMLDAHTFGQKLDTAFKKFNCTAKLNIAVGFLLKTVEDEFCRYYYAQEKNTLMERSKVVATKESFGQIEHNVEQY